MKNKKYLLKYLQRNLKDISKIKKSIENTLYISICLLDREKSLYFLEEPTIVHVMDGLSYCLETINHHNRMVCRYIDIIKYLY